LYQGCTVTKTSHLPIRYFLALLWAHPILHVSVIRVKKMRKFLKGWPTASFSRKVLFLEIDYDMVIWWYGRFLTSNNEHWHFRLRRSLAGYGLTEGVWKMSKESEITKGYSHQDVNVKALWKLKLM